MSFLNQTCKVCGEKFHNCSNCESWWNAPWREDDFCSEKCAQTTGWINPWDEDYPLKCVWAQINPEKEYCGEI